MKYETKNIWLFFLAFLMCSFLPELHFAQEKITHEKSRDAFTELETDSLVLRFFDALTGKQIKSADVTVAESYQVKTDFEGRVFIIKPKEDGFLKIKFQHPDYITSEFEIEILVGSIFFNRFSVSPKLPIGALRIVLDWDADPKDLDAHFVKQGDYHISFRNMKVSADGIAKLDRDDTDSYGPETITANKIDPNAEYTFYVHDFSNQYSNESKALSNSKACVKVFGDNKLMEVFNVPQNNAGNKWEVFKIKNGQIE
jgi:hypothetical protein